MISRSKQLWMAAYFLSKFAEKTGENTSDPPTETETPKWKDAYRMFYETLGGGRTVDSFEHTLKNMRDAYDSHLDSNRVGWLGRDGQPNKLHTVADAVMHSFSKLSRAEIWDQIAVFADVGVTSFSKVIDDLSAVQQMELDGEYRSLTEGGERVIVSVRYERNPRLRNEAFKAHGYDCAVCGFNFGVKYGEWGRDFAEVHHLIPVSELDAKKRKVDPAKDLIVLCANCHRMIHRKKRMTLTVEELKLRIAGLSSE